ncbi:Phosphoribosylaminoimidazolecarboxamide formyltransferase/IMP cyclohydrolase [Elusimicrobium minutum Pei191]|uniref:Bifunctional purine biosynthesis protein PurH n=1 Tax=Elusimicrobium minutum (strain Pei191) TaxID=445932 RepID=PUR9_ELUMP|nr:bifunctional phosphoribosylaminoimidazolecarboxamide formyltransferase/IMP cyclohydrolase [Elusimicrobium minutum]B2KCF7.1 RecName: Full=Bifunctional purine biosynthesis protein PurH; Includes: RecName: Full=Phosphoribosylaminoimidazolecarboxamide formyltransferase; AltName: Full=AICAR transformylase; Includes: RecName: Full=IMP cyclohydrolase; AltName: Full=ATIC; AltName: Full=IMP synthase; AltName: Full=Inosinicase [Elusimicrobium minutum Pei191]ACC98078.1 Phosphoribosylaminoimidazolecarboxa
MTQERKIKRALISVSDKTGLEVFAKGLHKLGVELVSTSGTAKFLKAAGLPVRDLSDLTGFPEILDGRVKTLHPRVHGAILYKRDDDAHCKVIKDMGIEDIDMLVVNLYPFRETAAKAKHSFDAEVIENIDIGGPSMLRSAAKNFAHVAVLCRPKDYEVVLSEMAASQGALSYATRQRLCVEAFTHTAEYDAAISEEFKKGLNHEFPESKIVVLHKTQDLRYGENPHQKAVLYSQKKDFSFEQLHGKELSYNNILDAFGTWDAVCDFDLPACVIFKHVTPCGIGTGKVLTEAFNNAWACDPKSAFGGIIALNKPMQRDIAEAISKVFIEAVCAPDYDLESLEILKQKKNIRILKRNSPLSAAYQLKSVGDEVLLQQPDRTLLLDNKWDCVTKRKPTEEEDKALKFAWASVKHVKSNAVILTSESASVGIGAGQMSRVDSVKMAGMKFEEYLQENKKPKVLVIGSDAFFPFRDGVDAAAKLGVSAIVQPGGSVRDEEAIAAADEHGIAMIFTGLRHFRH